MLNINTNSCQWSSSVLLSCAESLLCKCSFLVLLSRTETWQCFANFASIMPRANHSRSQGR